MIVLLIVLAFGIPLSVIDVRHHRLPNSGVLLMALTSGVALVLDSPTWTVLLGSAAALAFYAVLAALPGHGMGMGDVKLAAVLGALMWHVSIDTWVWWMITPFALGSVLAVFKVLLGRAGLRSSMAFGPWMFTGAVLALALTW